MNTELLYQATAFIWQEADLLDHAEYADWLKLWTADGLYVIPIDPKATNFEDTLNYAYDDAAMRGKRVDRLVGGESISTTPAPRTVRSVSRVRVLGEEDGIIHVRCAQDLHEFRKTTSRQHAADVSFELVRDAQAGSFFIRRKIIRLLNSTDVLTSVGFIL
ncbi:aromatic-ring-hydroxylating dioxygenase subunit beta [soil metagenome]